MPNMRGQPLVSEWSPRLSAERLLRSHKHQLCRAGVFRRMSDMVQPQPETPPGWLLVLACQVIAPHIERVLNLIVPMSLERFDIIGEVCDF